ncbi:FG-GAP repeat domain-containing protein [Glycomyces arizonensis]|uniref:FG-GAP repeat domain-containing protein n=1 Tax=Glycomyces arizonensis TaxID=256035 RepID=UPI000406A511|nr:VCBS repeat-containing protein [Glycomyces arizonensis]
MNSTPPPKRGLLPLRRTAAATAAAVGAALLIAPVTANAQEAVDCAELGDNPMTEGIEAALDAAAACDVEVRVFEFSQPYMTVSATPEGRLHLVSTAEPVQDLMELGQLSPTLVEWNGYLTQDFAQWPVWFDYEESSTFLVESDYTSLSWSAPTSRPSHSGTTAVYDDLAAGLDLAVDVDVTSMDLRFAVADEAAWAALASRLSVDADYHETSVSGGALHFDVEETPYPEGGAEWTTPFTVRDADGAVTPVELALDGGRLDLSLPEGALEAAAFPLEVSTQWVFRYPYRNEWGAVTSAAPELALFGGEGGLDAPYFEAAGEQGDAIVGAYCDDLADPECAAPAQASAYWNFNQTPLESLSPSAAVNLSYPMVSASFTVDAAEGTTCVAPDLRLTEEYTPATVWAGLPAAAGSAGTGSCQDGTAVYDVTEALDDAWKDHASASTITFGMTDSAQTARFDGGSGRLDVYYDVTGFRYTEAASDVCSPGLYSRPPAYSSDPTPAYGGFTVEPWRSGELDGLTWTATFYDDATDATVLTTEPRAVDAGAVPLYSVDNALDDGRYRVVYEFAYPSGDLIRTDDCYIGVDTSTPEFVSITIEGGTHHVGDDIAVDIEVSDADFPDGWNTLIVNCLREIDCGSSGEMYALTRGTTVELSWRLFDAGNSGRLSLQDKAGNTTPVETFNILATYDHRDYNGDGLQDMLSVRKADGALMFYAGQGDGTFASGISNGHGWDEMDIAMSGDLTGDGIPDLLARRGSNGYLYTYPGDGEGAFLYDDRIAVGPGWNSMSAITSAGDFDEDGTIDLLAVRKSDGKLYFYPGRGDGTFGGRSAVGTGWNVMDTVTTIGDIDRDGHYDLLAHDSRGGEYRMYFGDGDAGFDGRVDLPSSLDGSSTRDYSQVAAVGDIDGDDYEDVVAVDSRTGELVLHSFAEDASPLHDGQVIGTGWGAVRLPTAGADRTYDYNGDGAADVIALRESDGNLYFYPGNGEGNLGGRSSMGSGWNSMDLVTTAGDFDSDGFADLFARDASSGRLYLYPGDGRGGYGDRIDIGSGWDAMSAIVGGHDYDGDGKADIIARQASTGHLYLYPGDGSGGLGDRIDIGWGWNAMREITAVGDLDHDGHGDLLAVRESDGCLFFYGGHGDGTFSKAEIGCGWNAMDALAGVGDFNGDGHVDWLARKITTGDLYFYPGDGDGDHGSRGYIGWGWNSMSAIA